jgi:hypothetical protein
MIVSRRTYAAGELLHVLLQRTGLLIEIGDRVKNLRRAGAGLANSLAPTTSPRSVNMGPRFVLRPRNG